ncbi:MAG: 16S rRNA (guanine(966)-N(2))-methyltransferase RsmD [Deltaproteobacteria bacterium]|nr:MAG: 16S rRNA (guanine(966)-N(2))-methyltransferase RsmD [Deltaproteobacteria bacterium]
MALRLTGGRARGRALRGAVRSGVRPTTERVREALFSILGQDLTGQTVLDAFGGAGLVGLECWSRGAVVTLVEQDRAALVDIRARGEQVGATWTLLRGDIYQRARRLSCFDGVFLDPPYAHDPVQAVERLAPLAKRWLVLECERGRQAPERAGELPLDRHRVYGATSLWVYRNAGPVC